MTGDTAMTSPAVEAARQRLAQAQDRLLATLVAGGPVPEGFDGARIRLQSRMLAAKRAGVVARIAPELPGILSDGYQPAFVEYATAVPYPGRARLDAMAFARRLLDGTGDGGAAPVLTGRQRKELRRWVRERSGPPGPVARFGRLARTVGARLAVLVGGER